MKTIYTTVILLFIILTNTYGQKVDVRQIQYIKDNYVEVNKIKDWKEIKTFELMESSEGGEAKCFFTEDSFRKIIVSSFGETGKSVTEYYFDKSQNLIFIYEKITDYHMHILQENFTKKNATTIEVRSYFYYSKLIKQINSGGRKVGLKEESIRLFHRFNIDLSTMFNKLRLEETK